MAIRTIKPSPAFQGILLSELSLSCKFWQNQLLSTNKTEFDINKWENVDKVNATQIWNIPHRLPIDNKVRQLQYKILHNIVPCNKYLHRCLKLKDNDACGECGMEDNVIHYILQCSQVTHFWVDFSNFLHLWTHADIPANINDIVYGYLGNYKNSKTIN